MCLLNGRTSSSVSKHREMSHGNSGIGPESRNIYHEVGFGRGLHRSAEEAGPQKLKALQNETDW